MTESRRPARHLAAIVQVVWPITGLAYAVDDGLRTWGITRSTPGLGLQNLQPGQRIDLTVVEHDSFELVSAYAPLD
jgi:hypothetical protein